MKKKILLTMLLMLLFSITTAYAQKSTDEKVDILYGLGIIDEEFAEKKIITTQDYISAVVNMISNDDISKDASYAYAKKIGIAGGISEFNLKKNISAEDALKVSLRALGYGKILNSASDKLGNLQSLAAEAGLTNGVNISDLDGKNAVTLLFNLSEADMMELKVTNSDGAFKLEGNGETILSHYRSIDVIEGNITATYNTSLLKEDGLADGRIEIDNREYDIDYEYSSEMLGMYVQAYIYKIDRENRAIYVSPDEKKHSKLALNSEDIESVDNDFQYIEYLEGDSEKSKKAKLSPVVKVIFNGKLYPEYTAADLKPEEGNLVLSDTDNDGKYDIVFAYSYKTIVAETVSALKMSISNKFTYTGAEKTFKPDADDDKLLMYDENGNKITFSSIKSGNILSIAESKNSTGKLITVYVSSKSITGTIQAIDNADKTVTVDGDEYDVADVYYAATDGGDAAATRFSVGNSTVLYFNHRGKVVYAKNDKLDGFQYVYMLKQKNFEDETYAIRAMNLNGEWNDYFYSDRVKADNFNALSAEQVYTMLGENHSTPQLVMIKLNKADKIIRIKTAEVTNESKKDSFTQTPFTTRTYWNFNNSFNCKEYITKDTPVILTPKDDADRYKESEYQVGNSALLRHWTDCYYSVYNKDEMNIADIVVAKEQKANDTTDFLVNSCDEGLNEDNETVKVFNGCLSAIGGMTVKEYTPGCVGNYKNGDIIGITLKDGKIKEAELKYSLSQGVVYKRPSGGMDSSQNIWGVVTGIDVDNGLVSVDCSTDGSDIWTMKKHDTEFSCMMYNRDTKKYEVASLNEIEKGDFVMLYSYSCRVQRCYIIKR